MATCSVSGCKKPSDSGGMCSEHYAADLLGELEDNPFDENAIFGKGGATKNISDDDEDEALFAAVAQKEEKFQG